MLWVVQQQQKSDLLWHTTGKAEQLAQQQTGKWKQKEKKKEKKDITSSLSLLEL